jgi:Putative adhesin
MAGPAPVSRVSSWGRLVIASAVLVGGGVAALVVGDLASRHERIVSFAVRGSLDGVTLDVGAADVVIAGGGQRALVTVRRTDRYAFGHDAQVRRSVAAGMLRIRSRCPSAVPGSCSARYRIVVPDNVPVDVRTGSGTVRFSGYRGSAQIATGSGDVVVDGFCGFSLDARARSGDVSASVACAPQQLSLRSTTGSVRALVPAGRYRVDAESASGDHDVRGVAAASDAPFAIQALSSSGDVTVEGRR